MAVTPTTSTTPSTTLSATSQTILEAARRTIAARGPERLNLAAVAAEAGVSRPTLYRWFPNKALLLGALAAYAVEQFDAGLLETIAAAGDDAAARLDAALRFLVTYLDVSLGVDAIHADAEFSLQSLADSLGPHVDSLARALGDALDEVPSVRVGVATREQTAEMFLRLAYSQYLVPDPDPERLLGSVRAFAGLTTETGAARRRAGRRAHGRARRA